MMRRLRAQTCVAALALSLMTACSLGHEGGGGKPIYEQHADLSAMIHGDALVQVSKVTEGEDVGREIGTRRVSLMITTAEVSRVLYVRPGLGGTRLTGEVVFGAPKLEGYPSTYESPDELSGAFLLLGHRDTDQEGDPPEWTLEAVLVPEGRRAVLLGASWLSKDLEEFRAHVAETIGPTDITTVDLVKQWVEERNQIDAGSLPDKGRPGRSMVRAYGEMGRVMADKERTSDADAGQPPEGSRPLTVVLKTPDLERFDGWIEIGAAGEYFVVAGTGGGTTLGSTGRWVDTAQVVPGQDWRVTIEERDRPRRTVGTVPAATWDIGPAVVVSLSGSLDHPTLSVSKPSAEDLVPTQVPPMSVGHGD